MEEHKNQVRIISWPKEPAKLEHQFKKGSPAEVEIKFIKDPANVIIQNWPKSPMNVDMDMHLKVKEPVPVCISLCEPVCAKSDYTISINILDRPLGSISIKGITKLFNCFESLSIAALTIAYFVLIGFMFVVPRSFFTFSKIRVIAFS